MIVSELKYESLEDNNFNFVFEAITPEKIVRYLKNNNWTIFRNVEYLPIVNFIHGNDKYTQVIVPKEQSINFDYKATLLNVFNKLALVHNKTKEQVIDEIININKYILEVKYDNIDKKSFNIPAVRFENLTENAKKLYLSAYADANLKHDASSIYRRGNFPSEIREIEKMMEFGQTRQGSYIIPLLIPIGDKALSAHGTDLFETNIIDFEKETKSTELVDKNEKAIIKLIHSIDIVKKTVDEKKSLNELFDKESDNFVSVDFLNALGNITDHDDSVSIDLSTTSPKKKKTIKTTFTPKYTVKVSHFVEEFKKKFKVDNIFTGKLKKISVDQPDVTERKLLVTSLIGLPYESSDDKTQTLTCEFTNESIFEFVFQAIEKGLTVKVIGETRQGNRLYNCSIEKV